ncbi:MAG: MerR family transcriptional regulator [Acidobacteria bacterium]|nr:MerR family transcriptional regulator [Acidobacteriota bacterium]
MELRHYHMISWVAERYSIHPQTLRLYEREGLLTPNRSVGNTRLYDDPTCERLEFILALTRDLGVNLAGVEVILNMKDTVDALESEVERLAGMLQRELMNRGMTPREYALATRPESGLVPGDEE